MTNLQFPRDGTSNRPHIESTNRDSEATAAADAASDSHPIRIVEADPDRLRGVPGDLDSLTADEADALTRRYLERLRKLSDDAARITDKMPYNFRHLGFIQLLFPKARIIHCMRDPLDTCLSCFFRASYAAITTPTT